MKPLPDKFPASLLTGIIALLFLLACNKDPYQIGIDLLPPSDTLNVRTTDTCTVEAFSVRVDSVRSDNVSALMLGSIMDPVFGLSTSSFYTQVLLSSEEPSFGTHPVLDSLVLVLFYLNHYGDTITPQNVRVYEINDHLSYDSVYFSNRSLNHYPVLLGDLNFIPKPKDSVVVSGDTLPPCIRINLSKYSNYLGNKLLYAPSTALASYSEFIKFFKGLYVTTTPVNSGGSLFTFSVTASTSKMVLYFHDGNDPSKDSLKYEMPISDYSARFNHYDHNQYINADQDLKRQLLNRDSSQGANKLYLQGLGGVRIKLKFPFMKQFGKGKVVAINDALLLLKNNENDTTFAPPSNLTILRQDSAGRISNIIDAGEGGTYFGGTYNETERTYFFRITQHIQKVILNDYSGSFDLYMYVTNPYVSSIVPNRVVLNGTGASFPGNSSGRFQLKMTYTVLN